MSNNEYEPFKYKFRIFGYLISLIGLFTITIPQNNWIIIPAIIQNIYTIRALKIGPHRDIFSELKKGISYFREKGVNHNVINANKFQYSFIEIEIK